MGTELSLRRFLPDLSKAGQDRVKPLPDDFAGRVETMKGRMIAAGYLPKATIAVTWGKDHNPHEVYVLDLLAYYAAAYQVGAVRKGLCLLGKPASGKSYTLQLLSVLLELPYFDARDLAAEWPKDQDVVRRVAAMTITKPGTLVNHGPQDDMPVSMAFDDLGAEPTLHHYGAVVEVMADVLAERWKVYELHPALTFLASNLTDKALQERYGERTWSRIEGLCNIVMLKGIDFRTGNEDLGLYPTATEETAP